MRPYYTLILMSIGMACSCGQNTTPEGTRRDSLNTSEQTEACYHYSRDSNTVLLRIRTVQDTVSGTLSYDYYQKDKNTGTIRGVLSGDTLFATYEFMSEGMNSVREVAFLKKKDTWVEGYGEVQEDTAGVHFKNRHQLTFENAMVLQKTTCGQTE